MSRLRASRGGSASERGFALIELLVVLIIMGIVIAMVVLSTRGNDARSKQQAMASIAHQVFTASVTFNGDFPRIGTNDPLVNFTHRDAIRRRLNASGGPLPATESAENDLGLFTKTGQPFFKHPPANPYGGQVTVVRSGCPTTGVAGRIYICRPASSATAVRVTAWAKSKEGAPILVFDQVGGR